MEKAKKSIPYKNYIILMGSLIIVAIGVTFISPFDYAVKNASTFVNGITTSIGIISTVGASMNTLMFHEITKDNPKLRSRYFELIGFYFIPLLEAGISYTILASFGDMENMVLSAIRISIAGFFTAILVSVLFYIAIASELKMKEKQTDGEKKQEANNPKEDMQNINSKDDNKTVNITINM